MNTSLVNIDQAVTNLGLTRGDYFELAGDLKEYLKERLPELQAAIASKKSKDIEHIAHAIKGSFRNLHFIQAGDIAHTLEDMGRKKNMKDAGSIFQELARVVQASLEEVDANESSG